MSRDFISTAFRYHFKPGTYNNWFQEIKKPRLNLNLITVILKFVHCIYVYFRLLHKRIDNVFVVLICENLHAELDPAPQNCFGLGFFEERLALFKPSPASF